MHPETTADTLIAETPREDTALNAPIDVLSHCQGSRTVKVEGGMLARGCIFIPVLDL